MQTKRGCGPTRPPRPCRDRPGTAGQGQLFADAFPTYADTDKIPAVRGAARVGRVPVAGVLRVAVAVAAGVIAAGVTLGLVKAGVIGNKTGTPGGRAGIDDHDGGAAPKTPLVTAVSQVWARPATRSTSWPTK